MEPAHERDASLPATSGLAGLFFGSGVAIGVPWAVFRYGPEAGIQGTAAWWLALVGIAGGVAAMLRATGRPRSND